MNIHRSSYHSTRKNSNEPDVDRAIKRSLVSEIWNASDNSVGDRSIATMVNNKVLKLGRWLAGRLMEELCISSCLPLDNCLLCQAHKDGTPNNPAHW